MLWNRLSYCAVLLLSPFFLRVANAQQVQLNLFVNPQASASFSKWNEAPGQFNMQATNMSGSPMEVRIKLEFKNSNGKTVASTNNPELLPVITLNPGPGNSISPQQIFNTDYFTISEAYINSLGRNGNFPGGQYDLCASAISAGTGQVLTTFPVCGFFNITRIQSPLLIYPNDGAVICGKDFTTTVFQWTPQPLENSTIYAFNHFVLCEVYPGQGYREALLSNVPVVEQFIPITQNQFLWPENLIAPGDSQDYVWSVNIYDGNDILIADYSNPYHTVCRDRPRDTVIIDSVYTPGIPTTHHPPTTTRYNCGAPGFELLKGSEPTVGMTVDNIAAFPYPRAVLLRADGKDKDVVNLLCNGCGGVVSKVPIIVRDDVGDFKWVLTGKGSLNVPFDIKDIDDLAKKIAELLKKLKEINDSVENIKAMLDKGLDAKKANIEAEIEKYKNYKKTLEENKKKLNKSLDSLQKVISEKENSIKIIKAQIPSKKEAIKKLQTKMDSLSKVLKGGPGTEELKLHDELGKKRKEIDGLKEELNNLEEKWSQEIKNLTDDLVAAQKEIETAIENYNKNKNQLEAFARQVTAIEGQLMKTPEGKKFATSYKDLETKKNAFVQKYKALELDFNTTIDAGLEVLSTNVFSIRNQSNSGFQSAVNILISKVSGVCTGSNNNDLCKSASREMQETILGFSNTIASLVPTSFVLDVKQWKRIDSLKRKISGGEGALFPYKKAIEKATQTYASKQEIYYAKLSDIEKERESHLDKIEKAEKESTDLADQIKKVNEKRLADEDDKRKQRLDELSKVKEDLAKKQKELSNLSDSLLHIETNLTNQKAEKKELDEKIKKTEDEIKATDQTIKDLEKKIEKLKEERKNLEKRLKQLEKDKTKTEEELAKLKSSQTKQLDGNKTYEGSTVYYIPPPLEDIIKDKQKFQDLKDSVAKAEAGLQLAYANKEAVQGKIAKEIEKTAANLVVYAAAKNTIEASDKIINTTGDELARDKTRKYQEYLGKQKEAQDNSLKKKNEEENAEKEETKAEESVEESGKNLEEAKEKVKTLKEKEYNLEKQVQDKQNELANEEKLLANARTTLQDYTADLASEELKLKQSELKLSALKNDLTRANALQKEDDITKIKSEITSIEVEIKLSKETKIPGLRQKISSAEQSVNAAVKRLEAVQKQDQELMEQWKKVLEDLRTAYAELIKKNSKYEGELNKYKEKVRKHLEAQEAYEKAENKRSELQEDIAKQVDGDKDIEKKADKKKSAEEAKKKAEDDKTKANNEIEASQKLKDKLIKDSENELKKAKEKLKDAEEKLKDFLKKEFETVTLDVSIKLIGKDKAVDGWRTGDGEAFKIGNIIYSGSRIPIFTGTPAEDKSPTVETIKSVCNPEYLFDIPPIAEKPDPPLPGKEPRTIALIYKDGKPLWPEWPVIPNSSPLLAKDIVPIKTSGKDNDEFKRWCTGNSICPTGPPIKDNIKDLGNFNWEPADGTILGFNPLHPWMTWEAAKVPKPFKEKPQELKIKFLASDFAADDEKKESNKPSVKAGVLIECSKDTSAAPEAVYKLQGRVVTGDHKGLADEEIEFEVKLVKGEAKNYGFDGGAMKVTKQTDGSGYAKTDFNFGKGYAEFKINIRWKRGGNVIEECEMKAVSPLLLHLYRFATGAPDFAWDAARDLLDGGGNAESGISKFPKKGKGDDKKTLTLRAVAGLLNFEREFVKDENLEFSGSKKANPEKDKTKAFGLGRTHVAGVKEKEECKITVTTEQKYRPVTRPESQSKTYSNKQGDKFKIGSPIVPFVIIMDEPFNASEPVSGTGRLGMEIAGTEVLQYLKKVVFTAEDVTLEGEEDDLVATEGDVKWDPGDAGNFSVFGLDFNFTSVGIKAEKGATIAGKVKHSIIPNPIQFEAELDADGNFLGKLDSLPEVEIKKFKLKEGTAFDIDMHDNKSPGTLEGSFKGLLVRTAKLELPEVFNGAEKTPSLLEVSNFYIGTRTNTSGGRSMGFGGKASLTGSFFKIGYAGYNFSVSELGLEFENSELIAGSFKGEIELPIPFEGKVGTEVAVSGEGFSASVSTDRPVTIPKMGVSMTFLSGTGIEYNLSEKLGKLTINAFMVTKGLGEVEIKGFEVSSDGTIKAKEITLEKSIKFGSGFDLHAKSIGFSRTSEEISITVKGGFAFPKIGIENITGSVTVTSGPSIDVKLTGGKVKFDYNPVSFAGEFTYTGREFNGKFDIGIKKVLDKGIDGRLVVGNVEMKDQTSWNYWYAELTVGTKIPLGNTGLAILALGGGLGYNYIPPIGSNEGSAVQNESFSFKAIMEMGNVPGGEAFAGRMEMVLVPGMFSLYGKAWLLTQKESLYGEGQLNLQWSPNAQMDGYIGMFIGIPDAKGSIFQAKGQINFLFAGTSNYYIKSETLKASVLQSINGEANLDINTESMFIGGKLYYKLNKSIPLGIVTAKVAVSAVADAKLKYVYKPKTLNSSADFNGSWDVDLETPLGTADITNGDIKLHAEFNASPTYLEIKASASISYDVWIYADTVKLDLGYTTTI